MKKIHLLLGILCVVAPGCASSSRLVRELSKDNASVVLNISTIYGTARLVRANPPPGGEATIGADGTLTVRAATAPTYKTPARP